MILIRSGKPGPALEALRQAAHLGRDTATLHNGLGIIHAQAGRLEPAMTEFRWSMAMDPGYANARRNLAMVLKAGNRLTEGVQVLQEGLQRDPGSPELREAWGSLTGPARRP